MAAMVLRHNSHNNHNNNNSEGAKTMTSDFMSKIRAQAAERKKIHAPDLEHFSSEEQDALIELAGLYVDNPIVFDRRLKELKPVFRGATCEAIAKHVKLLVEVGSPQSDDEDVVDELIDIALSETKLWCNRIRVGFGSFNRDEHIEHHQVEGRDYSDFIADRYGETHKRNVGGRLIPTYPRKNALNEAIYHIEAHARRAEEKEPRIRLKAQGAEVWIDGGSRDWSGVKVTAEGWEVRPRLTMPLIRGNGMRPLPVPVRGGDIRRELRRFVNVKEEEFVLLCGNLATILCPYGNHLTTILCGPAGSGKTTTTKVIRAITDPHEVDTRRAASVRDLMHGAANTYVIGLENVSEISPEMSDTICALNTGTGYAERKYYNQGIERMWRFHCPVLINGIPYNLAERTDLADRAITFVFDYLGERARSDDVLMGQLEEAGPRLFGAVLDGLVGAMRMRREFGGDNDKAAEAMLGGWHPRFSDAVVWAEAACRAWGFKPGEFAEAYKNNQLVAFRYMNWLELSNADTNQSGGGPFAMIHATSAKAEGALAFIDRASAAIGALGHE
jgi:hypothetical protein